MALIYRILFISIIISSSIRIAFAQSGPGGVGNNLDPSNVSWYRADGSSNTIDGNNRIQIFDDLFNNDNDASQGSGGDRPDLQANVINGQPALFFDGGDDLEIANDVDINFPGGPLSTKEFFFVFRTGGNVTNTQVIYEQGGGTHGFNIHIDNGRLYCQLWTNFSSVSDLWFADFPVSINQNYFVRFRYNGGSNEIRAELNADNIVVTQNASAVTVTGSVLPHSGNIRIGTAGDTRLNDGSIQIGGAFTGHIAEVLLFNRLLNPAEEIILKNYVSAKYDLPIVGADDVYQGDTAGNGEFDFDLIGIGQASAQTQIMAESGAGLVLEQLNAFADDEFVVAAHNGVPNGTTMQDLPAGAEARWNRTWYIEKITAADLDATISFDFGDGVGSVPGATGNYTLLYRSTNSGNFIDLGLTPSLVNTDQIQFDVSNALLQDGYYTLGTTNATASTLDIVSVQDGNWNTNTTWNCNCIPSATSGVTVRHLVTLPSAAVTVANLGIDDPGELVTVNNRILTITNNLTVNGILDSREQGTPQENIRMTGDGGVLDGTGTIEFTAGLNNNNSAIFFIRGNTTIASTADLLFDQPDPDNPDFLRIEAGVTVTNNGVVTINRNLTGANATSTWTNEDGSTLNIGQGLLATGILNASSANNTVNYNGGGNQTIKNPTGGQYFNLTTSGTNTKTLQSATTILGDFVNSSTFNPANFDIVLQGNWTNNGIYLEGTETVTFNSGSTQTLGGIALEAFNNLTLSKSGTSLLLGTDVQVNGTLDMTNTLVNTNSHRLALGASTASTGTLNTSGLVSIIGEFERWVNAGNRANLVFPVGTASHNNEVQLNLVNLLSEGSLVAEFVPVAPSAITNPPLNDDGVDINNVYLEGYWRLTTANALSSNDYNISLTANGFSSFTPSVDTRVLVRANSSADWEINGDHVSTGFVSPIARRNNVSIISAEYTLAENNGCSFPSTSVISGPADVCLNDLGDAYSVTNTAGSTYAWSVTGGVITGGQGTSSITVDWGATGQVGQVQVIENNSGTGGCGNGTPVTLDVNVNPIPTSPIMGVAQVVSGQQGVAYSVESNAGYTYDWSISPTADHVLVEDASAMASVNWGATTGTVTVAVTATNTSCGLDAATQTLEVLVNDVIESAQTGDWNTSSTWVGGIIPSTLDNVRINANHVVTLPGNNVTVQNLEIQAGAELITRNNNLFTIAGNLLLNGILNSREEGTPQENIRMSGDGAILDGSGTIAFTAGLNNNNSHIFAFNNNITIAAGANITFDHQDADNPNFIRISSNRIVTNNGAVSINRNLVTQNTNSTWINAEGSTLTIGGVFFATGVLVANATGNTVVFNGAGNQTIADPQGSTYYNLTLAGTNIKSLPANTTVSNNLTISSILNANGNDLFIGGDWINTGTFNEGVQTVTFNGTNDQSITTSVDETFYNLSVIKGGTTLRLNSNIQVTEALTLDNALVNTGSNKLVLGTGTGQLGSLVRVAPATIIGRFERWVNTSNQSNLLFPVGTASNYNPITVSFLNLTPGSLLAEFVESNPGPLATTPLDDNGFDLNNTYIEGYWALTRDNSLSSTNYDVSLTANGFSSFTISSDTRIVTRANSSSDWAVSGTHVSSPFMSPTVQRNGLNILSAEYTIAENDNCSLPSTSVISGVTDVCTNDTGEAYSVIDTPSSTYNWTVVGGVIASGQGSHSITIDWGGTGQVGQVQVIEDNSAGGGCGPGSPVVLNVNINPIPASNLTGPASVSTNQAGVAYAVDNQAGYTYSWSLTPAADHVFNPTSPTSNTAIVDWGTTSGNVTLSVVANNTACGSSAPAVTLNVEVLSEIVSAQTGGWDDNSTWVGGIVPSSNSNVRVSTDHVVTLPGSDVTVQNLTIDQGGELITTNNDLLTIQGNLVVNGILDSREEGTPQENIVMTGDGAILDGTGIIEFTASLNNNNSHIFAFDANIVIASTANLTFDHQDASNPSFIRISSNRIVTNNGTVSINRNLTGQNANARWINNDNSSLTIAGTLLNTGILDASAVGNTVTYNGSSGQNIKNPSANTYYNLVLTGTNNKSLQANTVITNDLTINSTLNVNDNDLRIGGNWTSTGIFEEGIRTVTFDGSANQFLNTSSTETFYNLEVNKGAGTLQLNNNVIVSNQLSLDAGDIENTATLTLGTSTSNLGTLSRTAPSKIIGPFKRWIAAANQANVLFPVGPPTSAEPITVSFNALTAEGSLTVSFNETNPGANGLDITDGAATIRNPFTQGYWTLTKGDALESNDYDLTIETGSFDGNPFDVSTGRVMIRATSSDPWVVQGSHVTPTGNTLGRNNLTTLSSEVAIGTTTNCDPANTNNITGDLQVCINETGVVYTAVGGLAGSTYTWTVTGGNIVAGQGTPSVTVDWGAVGGPGLLTVVENNNFSPVFGCGDGSVIELEVNINPIPTSTISGSVTLGVGNTGVTYSVTDNGYDYTWTLPEGGTIATGQGTSSITIDWGNNPGTFAISVVANENSACNPGENAANVTLGVTLLEVIESAQSGDWNTASTWVDNIVPSSSDNVRINDSHIVTLPGANVTVQDLDIRSGGELITVNNNLLTIEGNLTVDGILDSREQGTPQENIVMTGDGAILDGTGVIEFTAGLNNNNSHIFAFSNNISIAATADLTFDQQDPDNPSFIRISSNRIVTNRGRVAINRNLVGQNANSTWVNDDGAVLTIGGTLLAAGRLDASGAGNLVEYSGNGNQVIKTPVTSYANLVLAGSNNKNLQANTTVEEDLLISGIFRLNGFDLVLAGNWTNTGTFTPGTNQVTFASAIDQTITNAVGESFYNLRIAKSAGSLVLVNDVTVNNMLTMSEGDVQGGANTLTLGNSSITEGTLDHTNGIIVGQFQRWINSASSFLFPVGNSTDYRPLTIDFTGETVSAGGSIITQFVQSSPGNNGLPFDDGGYTVRNTFSEGYWSVAAPNPLTFTQYDVDVLSTGFNSFTKDPNTRLVSRGNSSAPWLGNGTHAAASGDLIQRNDLSSLDLEFALGDETDCTPANTSAITRSIAGVNCINDLGVQYEVINTPGSIYTWTVDGGTITAGQGNNQVTIDWGAAGGTYTLQVTEDNSAVSGGCGVGTPVTLEVEVNPLPTSAISGPASIAEGSTGAVYSVTSNPNYTYNWTVTGGTQVGGGTTNSITIDWPTTTTGQVAVIATSNDCGANAAEVALTVDVFPVIESAATGNWNNGATWVGGLVPQAGNSVRILSPHNVTLTDDRTINNIEISTGGTLTIQNNDRLTVNGDMTLNGAIVDLEQGTPEPNLVLNGSGTTLRGTGSFTVGSEGLNNNNSPVLLFNANISIDASADLTFTQLDTDNPGFIRVNSNRTLINNGTVTINGTLLGQNANSRWTNGPGSTLNISGTLLFTGILNASQSNNTINYNGNFQTIKTPENSQYFNLTISGSNIKRLQAATEILGDLNITAGTFDPDNFNVDLWGNWTNSGNFDEGTGTVRIEGVNDQSVTRAGGETFNNLTIAKASGTVILNSPVDVSSNLVMSQGNINTGSNVLTLGTSGITTGTLTRTSGRVIGNFRRWIRDDSDGTEFLFPLGSAGAYLPLEFTPVAIAPGNGGSLTALFTASDPGSAGLPTGDDGGFAVENAFTEGSWTITGADGLDASSYNLDVTANGFSSFTLNADTRLISRTVTNNWPSTPSTLPGTHVAAVGNEVQRDAVTLALSTGVEIGLGDVLNCPTIVTSAISGVTEACINTSQAYSVTGTAGNTFSWTVTGGTFAENGMTTYSLLNDTDVTVNWGTTGGERTITVTESSGCTTGMTEELNVNINPLPAGPISGNTNLQFGAVGETYSVINRTNYTYLWSTPDGNIVGANDQNSVTVDWTTASTPGVLNLAVTFQDPLDVCPGTPVENLGVSVTFFDDFETAQAGDWDNPATWACNCVPDNNADIVLRHNVSLVDNSVVVADLSINAGAQLDNSGFEITVNRNYALNGTHLGSGTSFLRGISSAISGTGSKTVGTLVLDNDKLIQVGSNITLGGTVNIGANVTVTNNGTLNATGAFLGDNNSNSTFTNAANAALNVTSTNFLSTGRLIANNLNNTVTYNAAADQSVKSPVGAPSAYYNLGIAGTGNKDITNNLSVSNDITLAGGVLRGSTFDINIGRNWTRTSGSFTPQTGTVRFNGSMAQQVQSPASETFNILEINNTSSTGLSFATNDDVVVTNQLVLTDGFIYTSDNEQLILEGATISGGFLSNNFTSYVIGPLVHRVTGAAPANLVFPVGQTFFHRFDLENISQDGGSADYSVAFVSADVNTLTVSDPVNTTYGATTADLAQDGLSVVGYWEISRTAVDNFNSADIRVYYTANDGISDFENLTLAKADNTNDVSGWNNLLPTGFGGNQNIAGNIGASVTSFSIVSLANNGAGSNPLPVELVEFVARQEERGEVLVSWTTASEINNDYFEVQKSYNGLLYEVVGKVEGNGTTEGLTTYQWVDKDPYRGPNYYRLKQVDFDGTKTSYGPVFIEIQNPFSDFSVQAYPNPTDQENISVRIESDGDTPIKIEITDSYGKEIFSETILPGDLNALYKIEMEENLRQGVYMINIEQGGRTAQTRLMIYK